MECQALRDINKTLTTTEDKGRFTKVHAHGVFLAFEHQGTWSIEEEDFYRSSLGEEYEDGDMWSYVIISKFGKTLDCLFDRVPSRKHDQSFII